MKVLIIEDEQLAAEDLAEYISKAYPKMQIVSIINSVADGIRYFADNEVPDLIFSDIQLGDGLSFEIVKTLTVYVPIVFCTAYDEYALNAFTANGIDYVLKPYSQKTISESIEKFKNLQKSVATIAKYDAMEEIFENKEAYKQGAILVYYRDKIMPIKIEEIAIFYIENEITYLLTFQMKQYPVNHTLSELEKMAGNNFFRTSRQFLVNRNAIQESSHLFPRKLQISLIFPFKETVTVGKEKVNLFLDWLLMK